MTEPIRFTKKTVILLLAGVVVTAFLGVWAGGYFVQLKAERESHAKVGADLLLKKGEVFPDYTFTNLEGQPVELSQKLQNKRTVLLFISTECGPCQVLTEKWSAAYSQVGSEFQVLGISGEPVNVVKEYKAGKNLPFEMLADPEGKFIKQYKIDAFPTLIGLNEKNQIVLIEFGNRQEWSVPDYLKRL